jgi:hypothetical protein
MALIVKDRVRENSVTSGTGTLTLTGAPQSFQTFSSTIGNGNTTYYTITESGTGNFEVGLGTVGAGTLTRDTVLESSNAGSLVNFGSAAKDVFCTYPAEKAILGDTNAVSSTGTGSVVLNSNPTFATDITVADTILGVNIGSNGTYNSVRVGQEAMASNFIEPIGNISCVAIGSESLINLGRGVASFQNLVGGSGYTNGTYEIELEYLSGPILAGAIFPTVSATVSGGEVTDVALVSRGVGFEITQVPVLTYTGGAMGGGSGFTIQVLQTQIGTRLTAIGSQSGVSNYTGQNSTYIGYYTYGSGNGITIIGSEAYSGGGDTAQNSTYIGYGSGGSGSNEIAIGANATGRGNNTTTIGNSSTNDTYFYGKTSARFVPRVSTTTSSATPTINTDNTDQFGLTAQAVDITSFTTNLSGTPVNGQKLWIYIVGTAARAITWGASFESSTVTLPTTTVTTNRLDVGFVWNAATSKWRCVAVA